MKDVEQFLISQHYSNKQGVFALADVGDYEQTEADKVWSKLAHANPINAAAATHSENWYAKYPDKIEGEIPDEENLILDAGGGYGRVAIPLLQKKKRIKIVCVDASFVMLRQFANLLNNETRRDLNNRVVLMHSTINTLPFPDEMFDYVYSCAVLLHNPYDDTRQILTELRRILKPQGKAVFMGSFPNMYNLEGIQNFLYATCFVPKQANGPVRVYTKAHVADIFRGWSQSNISPVGITALPRQIANINLPFGNMIRRVNNWLESRHFTLLEKTSLCVKYFDVVAIK